MQKWYLNARAKHCGAEIHKNLSEVETIHQHYGQAEKGEIENRIGSSSPSIWPINYKMTKHKKLFLGLYLYAHANNNH